MSGATVVIVATMQDKVFDSGVTLGPLCFEVMNLSHQDIAPPGVQAQFDNVPPGHWEYHVWRKDATANAAQIGDMYVGYFDVKTTTSPITISVPVGAKVTVS